MLKNAFKKYPPQNRTNVQIKGGGVKGLLNNVQKKLHFFETTASLSHKDDISDKFAKYFPSKGL